MINGVTKLIMMKSDVLDTFDTIKACVAYKVDGEEIDYFPYDITEGVEPVYAELPGWLLAAGMDGQVVLETVLHGFDLEILETQPVEYRCYCSRDRVTRTLISLGRTELQSIVDDGKDIHIDCQFCDKIYDYTPEQVRQILKELDE